MHDVNLLGPCGRYKFPRALLFRIGWEDGDRLHTILSADGTHLRVYLADRVCCVCGNENLHELVDTRYGAGVCLGCIGHLNQCLRKASQALCARYGFAGSEQNQADGIGPDAPE